MPWLDDSELRVGLGCMRLPDDDRGEELALATIAAALEAGVTVFDTARAYGDNERLLARALARLARRASSRRAAWRARTARWIPDGRAKAIRADCEASLEALDGLPIDLYLIHTPDPRTPWRTSVRALARLVDEGLVRRVGVATSTGRSSTRRSSTRRSPRCRWRSARSTRRAARRRRRALHRAGRRGDRAFAARRAAARRRGSRARAARAGRRRARRDPGSGRARVAALAVAGLVAIPGARRPETARSAADAAALMLDAGERELARRGARPRGRARQARTREVVLVMGIPGAGKSRVAAGYVARGYERLNRDERGGTLRGLADALDELLVGRLAARRPRQHVPHARRAELRRRRRAAARRGDALRLARHAARAGAGQPRRAAARAPRLAAGARGAARARAHRAGHADADVADADAARARAAVARRGLRPRRARAVRARTRSSGRAGVLVGAAVLRQNGWRRRSREATGGAAPRLRLAPGRRGVRARRPRRRARSRGVGPGRGGALPASRRSADVLVPAAAPGPRARVRAAPRRRPARSIVVGASAAHRTLAATLGARFVEMGSRPDGA